MRILRCVVCEKLRGQDGLLQAGNHDLNSHTLKQRGLFSVKQRGAVKRAARSSPLSMGRQIYDSMFDFSPGKHIPFHKKSQRAVNRLVRETRKNVMAERVPGVGVDGTEGSMIHLAESLCFSHPDDVFHLDEYRPVCVGHKI